ncbi:MAG: adenine phosphoribosyltransferase [Lentisphaerae bacterium GWF2_52_8]|nr:MAG: adenine phosphoribosyltransferase [Lentisphaerae bacterium GWF2_52_8]
MSIETIERAIRDIPDFPKPGIIFKDVTPVLQSPKLFSEVIDIFASHCQDKLPDTIVGIESRGFIFGSALAYKLGCGFVPVRKKGKLPFRTISASYSLEYGQAEIEMHEDALRPGEKVLIVDDLLATGGTAGAAIKLISQLKAEIIGVEFLIELAFLKGRSIINPYPVNSLIVVK